MKKPHSHFENIFEEVVDDNELFDFLVYKTASEKQAKIYLTMLKNLRENEGLTENTKRCSRCSIVKLKEDFNKNQAYCRQCQAEYMKPYLKKYNEPDFVPSPKYKPLIPHVREHHMGGWERRQSKALQRLQHTQKLVNTRQRNRFRKDEVRKAWLGR